MFVRSKIPSDAREIGSPMCDNPQSTRDSNLGPKTAMDDLKAKIEAILFVADEPVSRERLFKLFPEHDGVDIEEALTSLRQDLEGRDRGLLLREIGGGFQLNTKADYDELLRYFLSAHRQSRLSAQALEALAIVAYEQPISTPEIREMRGSDPGSVLRTLLEHKLVKIVGRKEVVGRPFVWGTTKKFLVHFGLRSLDDLPKPNEFVTLLEERNGETEGPPADEQHEQA